MKPNPGVPVPVLEKLLFLAQVYYDLARVGVEQPKRLEVDGYVFVLSEVKKGYSLR